MGKSPALVKKFKELEEQEELLASEIRVGDHMRDNLPTKEDVRKMVYMIINSDVNSAEGRKWLIDIMISRVYVFDDKIQIFLKGDNDMQEIDFNAGDENANFNVPNVDGFVFCPHWGARTLQTRIGCWLFFQ